MFWQASTYAQPSPIEQILDKEKITLEELLDEDDLIQETKSLNGRLIDFLKQPDVVFKLLTYIVEPANQAFPRSAASQPSPEAKRALKYPYIACEVFCCEVEAIFSTLLENEELMTKLFSILDLPRPLDCVLAGYFSRAIHCLFMRKWGEEPDKSSEVMQFLEAHPQVLDKMISHVETTSVAEVLLRLLGAVENNAGSLSPARLSWMVETPVMDHLLEQLSPSASADSQHNAAYILSGIARSHFTPLVQSLAAPQFLARLFEFAFAPNVSMLALDVCIALLEPREAAAAALSTPPQSPPDSPLLGPQSELDARMRTAAIQEMISHMGRLREILEGRNGSNARMLTTYGVLTPPLGTTRLKAVEVVSALPLMGSLAADTALIESGLLRVCLDLFLQFPFNNLLHHLVTSIICFVLESGSNEVLAHLLTDCKLVQWLVDAPEEVTPQQQDSSDKAKPIRSGYLGHLTHVANRLAEAATLRDTVAAALGATPSWGSWVENILRTRNDTENVLMWSCGRPSKREVAAVSSVDELDADNHVFQDLEEGGPGPGASSRYSSFNDNFEDNDDDDLFPRSRLNGWDMWEDGRQSQQDVTYTWGSQEPQPQWQGFDPQGQKGDPSTAQAQPLNPASADALGPASQKHNASTVRKGFVHANDTTAAFRNLHLDQGLDADDSSSSSSSDEAELPLRRIPLQSVGLDEDAVVVNSDSDEDVDMDDETVMVGTASRVQPLDAGFTDFDDFGGFQDDGTARATPNHVAGTSSSSTHNTAKQAASREDEMPTWNAFADPTDGGWAHFSHISGLERGGLPSRHTTKQWNASGDDTLLSSASPGFLESSHPQGPAAVGSKPENHWERPAEPTIDRGEGQQQQTTDTVEQPVLQDFSTFNFWRQPVHDLEEEATPKAAGTAKGEQENTS